MKKKRAMTDRIQRDPTREHSMIYTPLQQAYKAILDTERKLTREGIESKWLDSLYDALSCINEEMRKPPPKREWVGLTDEDMEVLFLNEDGVRFARYIEAKLKEKNT
jgi:hypothetical protein